MDVYFDSLKTTVFISHASSYLMDTY